ncbi:B12-binding domain-containing radical SAM protein [Holophaga foetida]|uniref:B12-binding domain-containing radical SAM protein n=1 Tax=Holophaga foetida TaxID=35839 RepID=UPI00130E0E70|nr:radical SAM protein [Holophaga foetida]
MKMRKAMEAVYPLLMRIAFITPPIIKPSEPGLSAAAAAQWFRSRGVDAFAVDASIAWYGHTLSVSNLEAILAAGEATQAQRQAARHVQEGALRKSGTYADRRVYSSACNHLVNALKLASLPKPDFLLRVADVEWKGRRPQRSEDLEAAATTPGPYDAYFTEELIPELLEKGVTHAALSLTFLHQTYAAFRLAELLRMHAPGIRRWMGGPLVACWKAVGVPLDAPLFERFHKVCSTSSEVEMEELALELGGHPGVEPALLAPDLDSTPWAQYLVPQPTIPVALGRGCYWRRCTFCPDYLHPKYHPCGTDALEIWLRSVAQRFPGGAMLHLTDSALSPALLDRVASTVIRHKLPLRWHGFVRLEAGFARPGFAQHLAEGGCTLLQWGLETASARLLHLMDKGVGPEQARAVLRASAAAGIKNHAYLLFGLPTETEADREETLAFVQAEADSLHDLNASILNLPRRSPMHEHPERFGITELRPFGAEADLSLYLDFRCGESHPRLEARRWIGGRFGRDPIVKRILGELNNPFKANHACFLPSGQER